MAELPSGTVTFLFTDLEGVDAAVGASSRRRCGTRWRVTTRSCATAIEADGGCRGEGHGDGVHAAFATADAAVRAAVEAQLAMDAETWSVSEPLRVRIGVHTGAAELRDGDYFGPR